MKGLTSYFRIIIVLCLISTVLSISTCEFCGQNFEVIGRHLWCCQAKLNRVQGVSAAVDAARISPSLLVDHAGD